MNVSYADDYADGDKPTDAPMSLPTGGLPGDWATLAPEVSALPARVRITKRQQSAFYGTELDLQASAARHLDRPAVRDRDQLRGRGDRPRRP